jgi:hypothetical protein
MVTCLRLRYILLLKAANLPNGVSTRVKPEGCVLSHHDSYIAPVRDLGAGATHKVTLFEHVAERFVHGILLSASSLFDC